MSSKKPIELAGVIPFRRGESGWEFLVITSRKGHWIFPKGVISKDESPAEAARKECAEEAGVRGSIIGAPVGSYPDRRRKHPCSVQMFLLQYEGETDWKEGDFRRRLWCGFAEASKRLRKEPVRELLGRALDLLEQSPRP
ncbi:MAG: NUDIX hydrolase [Planctomycetota bacterium]|jgi:8-oxo-dGTP pyrophosphatase MutT (NUDIX family)